jgi:hypothetical protein
MSASERSSSPLPARIHLRIKHPQLDPNEITKQLGIEPEHTLSPGRSSGSSALHAECYWIAPIHFAMLEDAMFEGLKQPQMSKASSLAQVSTLQMMPHESIVGFAVRQLNQHQGFFQRVLEEGGTATLLITTEKPGSVTIHPSLARKLADLGLALELDWSGSVE